MEERGPYPSIEEEEVKTFFSAIWKVVTYSYSGIKYSVLEEMPGKQRQVPWKSLQAMHVKYWCERIGMSCKKE